jgi:hypothetical protein
VLCLWSQAQPWELHPAAINGGVVPSFTTKHLSIFVQATGLVPQCNYEICNISDKHMHP